MNPAKTALWKLPSMNKRTSARPTEASRIRVEMSRPSFGSNSIKKTFVHPNYITRPLDASTGGHLVNPPRRKTRRGIGRIEKNTTAHTSYSITTRQKKTSNVPVTFCGFQKHMGKIQILTKPSRVRSSGSKSGFEFSRKKPQLQESESEYARSPPRLIIERHNSAYQDFFTSINHSLGLIERIRCPESQGVLVDFCFSCRDIELNVNDSVWKLVELTGWHKSLLDEHREVTGIEQGVCGCHQQNLDGAYDEDSSEFPHTLWEDVLGAGRALQGGLLELQSFISNLCAFCVSVYNRNVTNEEGWRTIISQTTHLRDHYLPHTYFLTESFNEVRNKFEEPCRVAVTIDGLIANVI